MQSMNLGFGGNFGCVVWVVLYCFVCVVGMCEVW